MNGYVLNDRAVVNAYGLIEDKRFVVGTDWDSSHPTPADQAAFLEAHSWDTFALWHLAVDEGAAEETMARHQFAVGDFTRVHRSALVRCVERARAGQHHVLEEAAQELLHRLDTKAGIDVGDGS